MYNTDPDSLVDITSSFDTTTADAVSPSATHAESEKQLPDIPDSRKPPSDPYFQDFFTFLCKFTFNKPDLDEVWQEVRKENGWKTYNNHMYDELAGLRIGQVLVLFVSLACLMSSWAAKYLQGYSLEFYLVALIWSFILSSMGLLFQVLFGSSATLLESGDNCEEGQQSFVVERCYVLFHVCQFRMARFLLAYSFGCLAGALCIIVPRTHIFASLMATVTIGRFLDATFMKDQSKLTLLYYRRFGYVWFGILVHYLLWHSIAIHTTP
ncbi:hypothetical protein EV424DRAFT_544573 [Suillus variegatus]|nr:hypothetical protein EV424DRAFT_544573 [Suillus variegatus]